MTHAYTEFESPVGPLLLAGDESYLRMLLYGSGPRAAHPQPDWRRDPGLFRDAIEQLRSYFAGELRVFSLNLAPQGTPFQLRVWKELARIPYGETISYGQLAERVGNPKASRAVGLANGSNPISIILPCHRVIGSNGKLTGYGGGLPTKQQLLALERCQPSLL
jgi:methylated-DNA-[protein]-cysteine S-methyltransferase